MFAALGRVITPRMTDPVRIVIVSGSTRPTSQSGKVARFLAGRAAAQGLQADVVDLATANLPLWHEGFWDKTAPPDPHWAPVSALLAAADGIVLVSPEWNGMAPPPLMNLFLLTNKGELAHKPGLLVGVSSGVGGAYPIPELRTYGYKNTRICYLPDHLVVRGVKDVLNGPEPANDAEALLRGRIDLTLGALAAYASAFRTIRVNEQVVALRQKFANGM